MCSEDRTKITFYFHFAIFISWKEYLKLFSEGGVIFCFVQEQSKLDYRCDSWWTKVHHFEKICKLLVKVWHGALWIEWRWKRVKRPLGRMIRIYCRAQRPLYGKINQLDEHLFIYCKVEFIFITFTGCGM